MKFTIYTVLGALALFCPFTLLAGNEDGKDEVKPIIGDDGIEYALCSEIDHWKDKVIYIPPKALTIVGYKGSSTSIVISATAKVNCKSYAVLGIENGAFKGSSLEEVRIEKMDYIGKYIFADSELRRVTLASGIRHIGQGAFMNCPIETVCCESVDPIPSPGYDYMYLANDKLLVGYSNIFRSRDIECTILPDRTLDPPLESLDYSAGIPATLYVPKESIPEYRKQNFYTGGPVFTDKGGVWGYFEKIEPLENYDPSGVESVDAVSRDAPAAVYDLCGCKVLTGASESDLRTLPKGIYIYKGRKIII